MKLSAPIFQLKRKAKAMARAANIPLTDALNRVAEDEGFGAWSLLANRYAERDPGPAILERLAPGDMVLIGARPKHGKTMLALKILAAARSDARFCAYFTLEYATAEAIEILGSYGIESSGILLDTSDAICADYMIAKLAEAQAGAVVVVDYLQALDHQREKPALAEQVSALSAFAKDAGVIFVFISQIDRHYDTKAPPGIADVRMPNRIDTALFSKTYFLQDGEITFEAPPVG